jgi:hypothetical protein
LTPNCFTQKSRFNPEAWEVIQHTKPLFLPHPMKSPSRFLTFCLPVAALLLVACGGLTALAADEEKHDAGPTPAPEELKAVEELGKHGVRADQIAAGVNWRYVNFRGADKPDSALYTQLKAVPSIVELSLAGKQFTPADLANISGLKNLTVLNLSNSNVTDEGLAAVENLDKLTSLNLFSTGITDAGLNHLSKLKNLRHLYLAETKVTDVGVSGLKKELSEVKINRGAELPPPPATPAPKPEEKKPAAPAPKPEEKKPAPPAAKPEDKKPEEKKADTPAKPEEKKADSK